MISLAKVQQIFHTTKYFKNFLEKKWLAILTNRQPAKNMNKNLKPLYMTKT